jgi:hypothetical protein
VSATTFSPPLSDLPPVIGTIVSTAREFQLRTIPTGSFLTGPTQPRLISLVADADIANVLTIDEAQRIASNIAKLPNYQGANPDPD